MHILLIHLPQLHRGAKGCSCRCCHLVGDTMKGLASEYAVRLLELFGLMRDLSLPYFTHFDIHISSEHAQLVSSVQM